MIEKVKAIDNFRNFTVSITKDKTYSVLSTNIFGDYLILDDDENEQYCFSYKFVELASNKS